MVAYDDNTSVVADFDAFSETYIPSNILARSDQIREMQLGLSPAYRNSRPINAWLYGPPGAGKTMIARFILEKLKEESRFQGIYVNCWKCNSFYAILDSMLNELRIGFGDERDSRLKLYKFETFIATKPFVIVLDEIDLMDPRERDQTLYNLLALRKLGLICISESREPIFELEERVRSRLNPRFVHFAPYTEEELVEILKERALIALHAEAWNEEILKRVAELSKGDARTAIQTIRNAAQQAEQNGCTSIKPEHVEKAICDIKDLRKEYSLKKLSEDQRLVYELIRKQGSVMSVKLWNDYQKECSTRNLKPIARRTFSNYVEKLRQMNMIKIERARVKGKVYVFSIMD